MAATVPVVVAPALGSHHGRLMLVYTPLALAILIAMLSTGNTPALSIFERTQTRRHARGGDDQAAAAGDDPVESVIIALQGTILGLLIGVFFGRAQ